MINGQEITMTSFENSKILGVVGTLLMIIGGFAGSYSAIPSLVGLALLMLAIYGLADYYHDRSIFNNMIFGGIVFVAGVVAAVVIFVLTAAGLMTKLGIPSSGWSDPTVWQSVNWNAVDWNSLVPYLAAVAVALVVLFIFTVIAAILIRRSLKSLAQKSGTRMFATSGTVLFVGAILTIILIGFLLIWIALVLLLIAFIELKQAPAAQPLPYGQAYPQQYPPQQPQQYQQQPVQPQQTQGQTFCKNCGAAMAPGTEFCPSCGRKVN
jgi:uncharacterized membrane protein